MNLDRDAQGALLRAAKVRYDTLQKVLQLAGAAYMRERIMRELGDLERGIVELEQALKERS